MEGGEEEDVTGEEEEEGEEGTRRSSLGLTEAIFSLHNNTGAGRGSGRERGGMGRKRGVGLIREARIREGRVEMIGVKGIEYWGYDITYIRPKPRHDITIERFEGIWSVANRGE